MPNHCTNIVKAPKEVLEDLFDGEKITFEKLIPMPKEMNITESTTTEDAIAYAMSKKSPEEFQKIKVMLENTKDNYYGDLWKKFQRRLTVENIKQLEKYEKRYVPAESERVLGIRKFEEFGNFCLENISKHGVVSWYDWSIKNWGTKWDAYECKGTPKEGVLFFLTAWSPPYKVAEALFKKHHNSVIEWQYEGEGNEYRGRYYSDGKGKIINEEEEIETEDEEEDEV